MKKIKLLIVFIALINLSILCGCETAVEQQEPAASASVPSRLAELLGSGASDNFATALAPRQFRFPQDHGPHPRFRNEWWYLTGNLDSDSGRRFGFELTFFRFSLASGEVAEDSAWRSNQVYIAHFAVTDAASGAFHVEQRFSRGALGLAGASAAPFKVWIDDWSLAERPTVDGRAGDKWQINAEDKNMALQLALKAEKPPVLNGTDGLSRKSAAAANASYYYSISRLQTAGSLRIGDETYAVSGLSWLDREWSSSALAADQTGWDWFALQLSDGTDLMFYNIRKDDGSQDSHSAGTWIAVDGSAEYLSLQDIRLTVTDYWQSPLGGAYPAAWQIDVPDYQLSIRVTPVTANQELVTTVRYWEGAVDIDGKRGDVPIGGRGYVELTGYAD